MRTVLSFAAAAAVAVLGGSALVGCSHCDGALRRVIASSQALDKGPGSEAEVPANSRFTVHADSRSLPPDQLMAASGISPQSFYLEDQTGAHVEADVTAESIPAMHSCNNSVRFYLKPVHDLPPGSYRLVILLDQVKWPVLDQEDRQQYKGHPALVRQYRIVGH